MVWRRLLLIAGVAASLSMTSPAFAADAGRCTTAQAAFGQCGVSVTPENTGQGTILDGVIRSVETRGRDSDGPQLIGANQPSDGGIAPDPTPERPTAPPNDVCSPINVSQCAFTGAEPAPPPAGEPAVTLRDIASFRPSTPTNEIEPAGWAVVGLPANFVAEASVQTRSGTLLGRSAEVRFHPVAYRWTHSDGAVVQSSTPGATWAELGQAEFTATATSHAYATSGEFTVELAVVYVAEYRFDGSVWRWIDGTLTIPGTPQQVLVGEFDTVLVTGDCNVAPDGPGC